MKTAKKAVCSQEELVVDGKKKKKKIMFSSILRWPTHYWTKRGGESISVSELRSKEKRCMILVPVSLLTVLSFLSFCWYVCMCWMYVRSSFLFSTSGRDSKCSVMWYIRRKRKSIYILPYKINQLKSTPTARTWKVE